jgi:hypothetical protein
MIKLKIQSKLHSAEGVLEFLEQFLVCQGDHQKILLPEKGYREISKVWKLLGNNIAKVCTPKLNRQTM